MSECLASVWLITYNHEKFIAEAIDSALTQITDFDFEIVIGDDCSTDGTTAIVQKYKNDFPERIKTIYQQKNVGALRNAYEFTLSQCKGKYIAPLEGDDYWIDPYRLQKQVDFLERNPEYGLIYGNQYHLEPEGKLQPYIPSTISTFEDLLFNSSIPTASTCLRKVLIDQFAADTSFLSKNWHLADFPLWLWIFQNSKIHHVDEFYSVYRRHAGSVTDFNSFTKGELFYLSVIDVKKYFYSYYKGEKPLIDFIRKEYHSLFLLSLEYRMVPKCVKYFPYSVRKNINFIGNLIKSKFSKRILK